MSKSLSNSLNYFDLGLQKLEKKEYKKAIYFFERSIDNNPEMFETYNALALTYRKLGNPVNAHDCLCTAIQKFPHKFELFYNLASTCNELEEYDDALVALDKALEMNPGYSYVWVLKGSVLMKQNRFHEALFCFNQSISLSRNDEYAYYMKASVYDKMGNYKESFYSLDSALKINKKYLNALKLKAALHFKNSSIDAAFDIYKIITLEYPSKIDGYLGQANCFRAKGLLEQSLYVLRVALTIDEENSYILYQIAQNYIYQGLRFDAIYYLKKAIFVDQNNPEYYNSLGEIYFSMMNYHAALNCFKVASEMNSKNITYLSNKAMALFEMEIYDDAFLDLEAVENEYEERKLQIVNSQIHKKLQVLISRKAEFREKFLQFTKSAEKDTSDSKESEDLDVDFAKLPSVLHDHKSAFKKYASETPQAKSLKLSHLRIMEKKLSSEYDGISSLRSEKDIYSASSPAEDAAEEFCQEGSESHGDRAYRFDEMGEFDLSDITTCPRDIVIYFNESLRFLELFFVSGFVESSFTDPKLKKEFYVYKKTKMLEQTRGSIDIAAKIYRDCDRSDIAQRSANIHHSFQNLDRLKSLLPKMIEISTNIRKFDIKSNNYKLAEAFIEQKLKGAKDLSSNFISNLAINDAKRIIAGFISGNISEENLKDDIKNILTVDYFDRVISEFSDREFRNLYHEVLIESENQSCIVMSLPSVYYDNPILNNAEIVKKILSHDKGKKFFNFILSSDSLLQKWVVEYLKEYKDEEEFLTKFDSLLEHTGFSKSSSNIILDISGEVGGLSGDIEDISDLV